MYASDSPNDCARGLMAQPSRGQAKPVWRASPLGGGVCYIIPDMSGSGSRGSGRWEVTHRPDEGRVDPRRLKRKPLRGRYTSVLSRPSGNYVQLHYTAPAPCRAISSTFQRDIQGFAPTPASIGIPISGCNAQCPYSLIRSHYVAPEPRHLCCFIRIRYIAIPAFRSPELSGAPGVTSGL
jgi:hypothetical protein